MDELSVLCHHPPPPSLSSPFTESKLTFWPHNSFNDSTMSHAEFRRQIHIQSEQKRRAEIKDGFEELRRHLPTSYTGRKMSKAVLLQKGKFNQFHERALNLRNMKQKQRGWIWPFIHIFLYHFTYSRYLCDTFSCITSQKHVEERVLPSWWNQSSKPNRCIFDHWIRKGEEVHFSPRSLFAWY